MTSEILEEIWEEIKMLKILKFAEDKGIEKGRKEGIEEGIGKGIEKGRSEERRELIEKQLTKSSKKSQMIFLIRSVQWMMLFWIS